MVRESLEETRWRKAVGTLLDEAPQDYSQRYKHFVRIRGLFYNELGRSLEPSLREFLLSQPQDTLAEKTILANCLNEELHHLGMAILCPHTGRPAKLAVYSEKDDSTGRGYYALAVQNKAGIFIPTTPKTRRIPLSGEWILMQDDSSLSPPLTTQIRRDPKSSRGR